MKTSYKKNIHTRKLRTAKQAKQLQDFEVGCVTDDVRIWKELRSRKGLRARARSSAAQRVNAGRGCSLSQGVRGFNPTKISQAHYSNLTYFWIIKIYSTIATLYNEKISLEIRYTLLNIMDD
jgi:hypothetical protein